LPMYVVLLNWRAAAVVAGVVVLTSWILKKSWYDQLDEEAGMAPVRSEVAGG